MLPYETFEPVEVFRQQELAVVLVGLDAFEKVHPAEIGAGGAQSRHHDLIERILCGQHDDFMGSMAFARPAMATVPWRTRCS